MSNVPKLKIDSSFFNKLDSLHKSKSKKVNTNTENNTEYEYDCTNYTKIIS